MGQCISNDPSMSIGVASLGLGGLSPQIKKYIYCTTLYKSVLKWNYNRKIKERLKILKN